MPPFKSNLRPNPWDSFLNYGAPSDIGSGTFGLEDVYSPVSQAAPITRSIASTVNPATSPGLFSGLGKSLRDSGFLSSVDKNGVKTEGWGGLALGTIQGLGSAYMGMKQYGLAKDALKEGKRQFEMNFDAQRRTTNAALGDRQRARLASNPGAYQSEADYMSQYGIR